MILVFLNWVLIFFVSLMWGSIGGRWLAGWLQLDQPLWVHPSCQVFFGLGILTFFGNTASLFLPLSLPVCWSLYLAAVAAAVFYRRSLRVYTNYYRQKIRRAHPLTWLLMLCVLAIALMKASGPTEVPDEGEYYLPLVRWIEQYAVVPGTGLLNDRMGYNSAFHLTNALFSQAGLFPGGLYDLNAFIFVVFQLYGMTALQRLLRRDYRLLWSDLLLVASGIFIFRKLLTSLDSDFPANFIGILVLALWLEKIQKGKGGDIDFRLLLIGLLSVFLVTVKLTMVFLLALPAIPLWQSAFRGRPAPMLVAGALGLIYALPWLARNYYLTGYLLYPVYFLDLFQPDWKIPQHIAEANYHYISEHAKTLMVRYTHDYAGAAPLSLSEWWPTWLAHTRKDLIGKVLLYGFLPALAGNLGWWWASRRFPVSQRAFFRWTLVILLTALTMWFFRFPAIRFGWVFCIGFLVLGLSFWPLELFRIPVRWLVLGLIGMMSLSMLRGVHHSWTEGRAAGVFWGSPAPVRQLENYTVKDLEGVSLIIADSVYCWGIDPPCQPNFYPTNIELRKENIRNGFRPAPKKSRK